MPRSMLTTRSCLQPWTKTSHSGLRTSFFPPKISSVCLRLANSFCLPVSGMITLVIALATIFSPTAYVTGLGSMVSPTLMVLGNIGFSSANKSGLYNLLYTQGYGCSQCPEIILPGPGRRRSLCSVSKHPGGGQDSEYTCWPDPPRSTPKRVPS